MTSDKKTKKKLTKAEKNQPSLDSQSSSALSNAKTENSNSVSSSLRQVKCPSCKKLTIYSAENPYRPFCSERCKTNDLGAWASESYKVPTNEHVDLDRDPQTEEED